MSDKSLSAIIFQHLDKKRISVGVLSKLSGVSIETLRNWSDGVVQKPQKWWGLVKVADALRLDEPETNELLKAAQKPSLEELLTNIRTDEEMLLLSPWVDKIRQRYAQVPFQVIADLPYFVGRTKEIRDLKAALLAGRHVTLYSLEGLAGVGKTVLAAHIAYLLKPYFPDGVLWARVDTSDTMSVLSTFANAYGHDVSRYSDVESRGRVVREILANKRALIILDNANSGKEVKPLLPPTNTCAVLVTTRYRNLSVTRGARRFELLPFDLEQQEALSLFTKLLGQTRAQQERAALVEIADVLGHLPLAIAIAASRMYASPPTSALNYLKCIRQEREMLNELEYDDESVRLSFNISYKVLHPKLQQFFAALGVFGGEDFGIDAVAYVTETPSETAEEYLEMLAQLSLIRHGRRGRFQLHPLLRSYAQEQQTIKSQWQRMVEFFVQFLEDHETEYNILEVEVGNVLVAFQVGYEQKLYASLVQGVNKFYRYMSARGYNNVAKHHLDHAEQFARIIEDTIGLVTTLLNLSRLAQLSGKYADAETYLQEGMILVDQASNAALKSEILKMHGAVASKQGHLKEADKFLQDSLVLSKEIGNQKNVGEVLQNLGVIAVTHGNLSQADTYYQEALPILREFGDNEALLALLSDMAGISFRREDYNQAGKLQREVLTLARKVGNRRRVSLALMHLGALNSHLGNYVQAEEHLLDGLKISREIDTPENIFFLLTNLGEVAFRQQKYGQAEVFWTEALSIAREVGHRWSLCYILNSWGELCLIRRAWEQGATYFNEALELGRDAEIQELVANSIYGLGRVSEGQGNIGEAYRLGSESLAIFESITHYSQYDVKRWLDQLPDEQNDLLERTIAG